MKSKSFQVYLEKRLDENEIKEIERQAKRERDILKSLQNDVSKAVATFMKEKEVGFNELVRRLHITPTQLTRIQRGDANLTLASIAHLFALLKMKPHIVT